MLLLAFCAVGLWEALIGALGWSHMPLPDAAMTVALVAAFRRRRDGDLVLALGAGLAAGLFGTGPWGLKALVCLAGCAAAGRWRGGERRVRGFDASLRAGVLLGALGLFEIVNLAAFGTLGFVDALAIVGRALVTAAVVGVAITLEGPARPLAT